MVRHIVMWSYKEGLTGEEREAGGKLVKTELENLKNLIGGIRSVTVALEPLPGSNRDVALDMSFESEQALNDYQDHPEHVRVKGLIGPLLEARACVDFRETQEK